MKLYDTLSRSNKEIPKEDKLGIYCCGPTVYGPAHIGNFRTFVLQDTLRRVLEKAGYTVNHVRNITDVDDKTIRQSMAEGQTLTDFTQKWTVKFHEDCKSLNLLAPHIEPRATDHIGEQIGMIKKLVDNGHAYAAADGSVYFKVSSFEDYGCLARLDKEALQTQEVTSSGDTPNLADEYDRESVSDFALWKAHKPEDGDNAWNSPWGKGRPGWHIECSAMSRKYLGDTFALHGGGVDLTFPHHENEIAQSRCCTGQDHFARHWFHTAHLMVEGNKMSKSLGNLYRLDELTAKGYSPRVVRYTLMSGHYKQQLNFTFNGLDAAKSALAKLDKAAEALIEKAGLTLASPSTGAILTECGKPEVWTYLEGAFDALLDDLNIPSALGELFSAIKSIQNLDTNQAKAFLSELASILEALGLDIEIEKQVVEVPAEIQALAEERWIAKQSKDWGKADKLRGALHERGWIVKDRKEDYDILPA